MNEFVIRGRVTDIEKSGGDHDGPTPDPTDFGVAVTIHCNEFYEDAVKADPARVVNGGYMRLVFSSRKTMPKIRFGEEVLITVGVPR